jgi:dipeptidyl aminopeptidase/acylaminoacyl peptidase
MRVLPAGGQVLAVTLAFVFAAASSPDRAQAAFPGENGRFALTWSGDRSGVSTDFVLTANKRGRQLDVVARCDYGCHHTAGDWSPSGHRLVYVETSGFEECIDCQHKLVKVAPDGRHRRIVYQPSAFVPLSSPVWSPDGRRIAFVEYHGRRSDIYLIDRDGSDLVRLTDTRRRVEDDLDWSSRNRLVFRGGRRWGFKRWELFTMRPNGQALRRVTNNDVPDSQPDWAPGGRRLTFTRGNRIWTMNASGKNATMIASGHTSAWAPDGSLIAFVSTADAAIHSVKPSGRDDTLIGRPRERGGISSLDWQPRSRRS